MQDGKQVLLTNRWRVWRDLADYFPVQLHKTADLDPQGTYVFGFHPHGILCLSAWVSFATEACDVGAKCVATFLYNSPASINSASPDCEPRLAAVAIFELAWLVRNRDRHPFKS